MSDALQNIKTEIITEEEEYDVKEELFPGDLVATVLETPKVRKFRHVYI